MYMYYNTYNYMYVHVHMYMYIHTHVPDRADASTLAADQEGKKTPESCKV